MNYILRVKHFNQTKDILIDAPDENTAKKKLMEREPIPKSAIKKCTPVWEVEILYCTNAGNPTGKRETIAADTAELAYNQLHDKVKNYKSCMKISGGTTTRI